MSLFLSGSEVFLVPISDYLIMGDVDDVEGLLESELTAEDIDQAIAATSKADSAAQSDTSDSRTFNDQSVLQDEGVDDPELEAIRQRVREMEQEQLKLKQMQDEVEKQMLTTQGGNAAQRSFPSQDEKMEADQR